MASTVAPAALVEGSPRVALPYGLFSVLGFRPTGNGRWANGVQWSVPPTDPAKGVGKYDPEPENVTGLPKEFDNDQTQMGDASEFTVYGEFKATPIGWSAAEMQDRATAHLLLREEARVEQALWTGDLGNTPNLIGVNGSDAPTVLTAATAYDEAIGALEEYIASTFGSQGVIHMTRSMATKMLIDDALEAKGGRLLTPLGTPVVAGTGYPGTKPSGETGTDTTWVYATAAVFGYQSEVSPASNRPYDLLDRGNNDQYAIAERTYLVGFDPGVGAINVTIGD